MATSITINNIANIYLYNLTSGHQRIENSIAIPGATSQMFANGLQDDARFSMSCAIRETTGALSRQKVLQLMELVRNHIGYPFVYIQFPDSEARFYDGFYEIESLNVPRDYVKMVHLPFTLNVWRKGTLGNLRLATLWSAAAETYSWGGATLTTKKLATLPYLVTYPSETILEIRTTNDGSNQVVEDPTNATVNYLSSSTIANWYLSQCRVYDYLIKVGATTQANALMICHYNGNTPHATDFTGNPNGHRGQVGTIAGGLIYRPGKFGKGVQVAEATTNLITNPSLEVDTTGYQSYNATFTRDTTQCLYGVACGKMVGSGSSAPSVYIPAVGATTMTVSPNVPYVYSVYLKGNVGGEQIQLAIRWVTGAGAYISTSSSSLFTLTTSWVRYTLIATSPGTAGACSVQTNLPANSTATYFFDAQQFEQKAYVTPYCDGSLGTGHSWSGTANASTSSRTAASVRYPISLSATAGTIAFWWIPANANTTAQATTYFFEAGNVLAYYQASDDKIYFTDGTNTISTSARTFSAEIAMHLAFSYSSSGLSIHVNGVSAATGATYTTLAVDTLFYLGTDEAGPDYQCNGIIDELIITDGAALTTTEILALYNASAETTTEPDSTMQVFSTDHNFVGDCLIQNGILRYNVTSSMFYVYESVTRNLFIEMGWLFAVVTDATYLVHFEVTKISSEEIRWKEIRQTGTGKECKLVFTLRRGANFCRVQATAYVGTIGTSGMSLIKASGFTQLFNASANGAGGGGDLATDADDNYHAGYNTTDDIVAGFALLTKPTYQPDDTTSSALNESNSWAASDTKTFFVLGWAQDTGTFVLATGRANAAKHARECMYSVNQELVLVGKGYIP